MIRRLKANILTQLPKKKRYILGCQIVDEEKRNVLREMVDKVKALQKSLDSNRRRRKGARGRGGKKSRDRKRKADADDTVLDEQDEEDEEDDQHDEDEAEGRDEVEQDAAQPQRATGTEGQPADGDGDLQQVNTSPALHMLSGDSHLHTPVM